MAGSTQKKVESSLRFAVTTSLRPVPGTIESAKQLAGQFNVPFVDRDDRSLKYLTELKCADGMLVVSSKRISFIMGEHEFFFHPGLAALRIKEINNGKTDQMISAMSLNRGDTVLDCTMGLGTDAIVASYATGAAGDVTGLENSPVISELVRRGLQCYLDEDQKIVQAMRRIKIININHKEYLASLKEGSYDIVYFDPMFRSPRRRSPGINAARMLANPEPLDPETVELAFNAAARRVVMKERRSSAEFERLGFKHVIGGKYSPVAYGIKEKQGGPE